ncbi:DHH family phosphoesterase [endosymbiont of Acanthamoeba sp. UWC8]|uniref:DHH family phosphoesterase n=1 Tax=endosymbiont of Acanthamoeba sp. UWC8 TaxID=86106 RepID=UPI00130EDC6A|nr:DHH family phosphoesterase [endosymbiont of Acanthamoeba sp. UWC8]
MEKPIIICAGSKYVDIDVLACAVAYKELLELRGKKAKTVFTGEFNKTVPISVLAWNMDISHDVPENPHDYNYVLVDISNPNYFEKFVVREQVIEVFDHHHGFEKYWIKLIGSRAKIETVGSCATLIWEEYKKHNKENMISPTGANLIYTAIISNTLNFRASITSIRDIRAAEEIKQYITLPDIWIQQYYKETEQEILSEPKIAIANDTKSLVINNDDYLIAQLELWNAVTFINRHDILEIALQGLNINELAHNELNWFLTIASIEENKNYIITSSEFIKQKLKIYLGAVFTGYIGETKQLFLRKEILKKLDEDKIY